MSKEARAALSEALSTVLERMAFMFAEESSKDELPALDGAALRASVSFKGHGSGIIELWVPETLCPEIAANVLGLEPDDEMCREHGADALTELLNVTCGQFLTDLYGEKYVFDLTPPRTEAVDQAGWSKALADERCAALIVEDRPVLSRIELNPAEDHT